MAPALPITGLLLRDNNKVKFPKHITEVCTSLLCYTVLYQTFLFHRIGPSHPIVERMCWVLVLSVRLHNLLVTTAYQHTDKRYFGLAQSHQVTDTYAHTLLASFEQVNSLSTTTCRV